MPAGGRAGFAGAAGLTTLRVGRAGCYLVGKRTLDAGLLSGYWTAGTASCDQTVPSSAAGGHAGARVDVLATTQTSENA